MNIRQFPLYTLLLVLISACSYTPSKIESTKGENRLSVKEQLSSSCQDIANDLSHQDFTALNQRFDIQALVKNSTAGIRSHSKTFNTFQTQLNTLLQDPGNLLKTTVTADMNWQVMKVSSKEKSAQCYLISKIDNQGFSIIEFYLQYSDNKISIVNWYEHMKGKLLTDNFRIISQDLKQAVEDMENPFFSKMMPAYQEYINLFAFFKATNKKDANEVIKTYAELAPRYQNNSLYALRHVEYSRLINNAQYMQALTDFSKRFADDKNYDLLLFDLYFEQENFDRCLEIIESTQNDIAESLNFYIYKAIIQNKKNDRRAFYAAILDALNFDYTEDDTYWVLLKTLVNNEKYQDGLLVLDVLQKGFSYNFTAETFYGDKTFQKFGQSTAYKNWVNQQRF